MNPTPKPPDPSARSRARLRRGGWSASQRSVRMEFGDPLIAVRAERRGASFQSTGTTEAQAWGRAVECARHMGMLAPHPDD